MATVQRCEIWSDFQCNSGVRLAILPIDQVTRFRLTTRLTLDDSGTLELSKDAAAAASLATGRVVRVQYTDASFEEWRVRDLSDTSATSRLVRVSLQSPLVDLGAGASLLSQTVPGVNPRPEPGMEFKAVEPSDALASILAFAPAWWAAGTMTPTVPVNMTADGWMPLRAIRALVEAINGQGVTCELAVRRNGTVGYYLDLVTEVGSAAAVVDVRTAKNLLSTTRSRDLQKYATEAVPLGAMDTIPVGTFGAETESRRATIGSAYFHVTAKSGTTVTVEAPETGGSVIAFDGQLDGLFLIDDAKARQAITSSGVDQQCDVASAANITVGRWYRLATDSTGTLLLSVRKAPAVGGGPVRVVSSALSGFTNFMHRPSMRTWAGASTVPPDDWTSTGSITIDRTTTAGFWLYGGKSARLRNNVGTGSLVSPAFTQLVPNDMEWVTVQAWVRIASTTGTPYVELWIGGTLKDTILLAGYETGVWHMVSHAAASGGLKGAVSAIAKVVFGFSSFGAGTGDMYADSVQATFSKTPVDFREGSNATRLFTLANRYLTLHGSETVSYTMTFADLTAWDPVAFPYDTITLGGTVRVRDTDLDITTTGRVVELTRDLRNPLASAVTVANRPVDLISTLTGTGA